jgi:hypothetical protein
MAFSKHHNISLSILPSASYDKDWLLQNTICLFFGPNLIVVIYVDNILIYGKDDNVIDSFITKMHSEDVALNKEGLSEGYLGIDNQCTNTQIKLTQSGLTRRTISALGLDTKWSTSCETPAECNPLARDIDGEKGSRMINYASVIRMLLYLQINAPIIPLHQHKSTSVC